jgi:enoyl-[acyl-carrier protein] reductase / trans-2-enoyl-CoA reductase (NAD+)
MSNDTEQSGNKAFRIVDQVHAEGVMIIEPKIRGFICTTAHPSGCAEAVRRQIEYVSGLPGIDGPKNVLVIGSSTGYGLASRIVAAFGSGAATLGVFYERPATETRTASAGWYNTAAFEKRAHETGLYAQSINGDAFSDAVKGKAVGIIKKDMGKVDLVIYSLASPRRTHPVTGETLTSVIKPVGKPYTNKTVDFQSGAVSEITIQPAGEDEIRQTVAVMGGEDWSMWMTALRDADALSPGATAIAYSYIGPSVTHAVYRDGTIGQAKNHLEETAIAIRTLLAPLGGRAFISVNKALVTQSSSAIPVVPLYISILFKVMKDKGLHEGCIEQIARLFSERLYAGNMETDCRGRIRVDDWEMRDDVQESVTGLWENADSQNVAACSDIEGYRRDFLNLFGFGFDTIRYQDDADILVDIPSLMTV